MNSLELHKCMHNLLASHSPSENEIRLTYRVPGSPPPSEVTLTLLFYPNTRLLASASVSPPFDIEDLIEWCVESNDVPGFISAVLDMAKNSGMA
jgi:hypothetical protein